MSCNFSTIKKNNDSSTNKKAQINVDLVVNKDSLILNGNNGVWSYKNEAYSGYAVRFHANNSLKEKTGFLNGKKEGVYNVWFENGELKLESHYDQNVLNGVYKSWWDNGVLASESSYINGKQNGLECKWYKSGKIFKLRNLLKGKEDGLQKAWLENGKLYVNYEAKNGRVFGMKRANSCYKLENEQVVRKQ